MLPDTFLPGRFCLILGALLLLESSMGFAQSGISNRTIDGVSSATTFRWIGGSGYWSDLKQWVPSVVPGNDGLRNLVYIDRGNPMASIVVLDQDVVLTGLAIDADDGLEIAEGHALTLAASQGESKVRNKGVIRVEGDMAVGGILLEGQGHYLLHGNGRIRLAGNLASVRGITGDEQLTNLNCTIHGYGQFGEGIGSWLNRGEIRADIPTRSLVVHTHNPASNIGLLSASNGGWLQLNHCEILNHSGEINACASSFVQLNGASVYGGKLTTAGNGLIRAMDEPVFWHSVTNQGRFMLGPTELSLSGTITNNGEVFAVGDLTLGASNGLGSTIRLLGDEEHEFQLTGEGTVEMVSADIHAGGPTQPVHFIHGAAHKIRGEGSIGDNDVSLLNKGIIIADGNSFLRFRPGVGRSVVNEGVIKATSTAGAAVFSGSFENTGTVDVREGSRFMMVPGVTAVNNVGGMLVGGAWSVNAIEAPARLKINGANILTNAADVTLSGPAAFFPRFKTVHANVGTIRLLDGHTFSSAGAFQNWGSLVVGTGSQLQINGMCTAHSGGQIEIILEQTSSVSHGTISISGMAALNGTLVIALEGDRPTVDKSYDIITADAIVGWFDEIIAPSHVTVFKQHGLVTVTVPALDESGVTSTSVFEQLLHTLDAQSSSTLHDLYEIVDRWVTNGE